MVRRREVASVSGVVPGDRLPRGDEDRRATFRVLRWYADQGWEGTQAHVELVPVGEQVDLGQAHSRDMHILGHCVQR